MFMFLPVHAINFCITPAWIPELCRFSMDPTSPENDPSEESTRESLIGISQLVPEKVVQPNLVTNSAAAASKLGMDDGGAVEEYRSELISISYTESPDAQSPAPENVS